ncbi:CoA-binding protein [Clostridium sp. Cult3]|uniref:CoA-binding protein n=1 Tax=Clostridium sp. Cult3 TaxID=2079004 RepID=UPI001F457C4D|nr:CoA-binding protein [Clostridium sp. Cult3]MCF6460742.1 CoA-binding protein [Clostridium sp. Cult3]
MIKQEMLDKKIWAVVGVTANERKYGYKIWRKLMEHGYETYGVNPNYDEIQGHRIYDSLRELPKKIDVIDIVVPPKISLNTLDDAKELGIEYIWFQPGTFNDEVIEKAKALDFRFLYDDCILATLIKMEKEA